jgi:hypothetical protein
MALRYGHARNVERRDEAVARVVAWVCAILGDDVETSAVSIGRNECCHGACGGNETTILLMRAGEAVIRLEIAKSLEAVTQAEVADAFAPLFASKQLP